MPAIARQRVFQNSLMSALLDGIYDGDLTIAELLEHGDFGLGTFDALDGEMLVLDGVCHRMAADGTVTRAHSHERTPFALVTRFVPELTARLHEPADRDAIASRVERMVGSRNYLYAIRLTGEFDAVTTRSIPKQSKPYRPLREVAKGEAILELEHVSGTIVGFETPLYESGIGVPGGHVHFVDKTLTTGGHVLDFRLAHGLLEVCIATDLELRLPLSRAFRAAELEPGDLGEQIRAAEEQPR
jgi:acetolactate decarboxylase